MTGVAKNDLKQYFERAASWDADRLKSALRSRNIAWAVAGGAGVLAICGVLAVATLSPLKTVEPFVVSMNETTGAVNVMTALTGNKDVTYNEAVTKYFLSEYVRTREGYIPSAAEEHFKQVSIMSGSQEQQKWAAFFGGKNPQSPQVLLGTNGTAEAKIRAISFVNDRVANVRFTRTTQLAQQVLSEDWIATITFDYTQAPLKESDRMMNPLGFQVASYRADPETVR